MYLLIMMVFFSCNQGNQQVTQSSSMPTLEEIAKEKFQSDFQIYMNSSGSHALVTKPVRANPNQLKPTIYFFVFNNSTGQVIYENEIPKASVSWLNDTEVLMQTEPGVYQPNMDASRIIYNIIENKEKAYISR